MPSSTIVSLHQFYDYCSENELPFAFYRLPGTNAVKIIAQKKSRLQKIRFNKSSIKKRGFLFSPFMEEKGINKVFIKPEIFCSDDNLPELNFAIKSKKKVKSQSCKFKAIGKTDFEKLVRKIKNEIKNKSSKKIVAAGVIKKKKSKQFNAVDCFQYLCKMYPDAFVSIVFTPKYGLWIGATPELLLSVSKNEFKTYSLAGTKTNIKTNLNTGWGKKEIEEQKLVSDYIAQTLLATTKTISKVNSIETVAAGNLLHLRTTFIARPVSHQLWQKVVQALHPTPAVAGLPKKEAIAFICKNEKSSRNFYSGYLGPVNLEGQISLFVNIRCMQVLKNKLAVYVGCGITSGSKPSSEWKEATSKSQTLLRAVRKSK